MSLSTEEPNTVDNHQPYDPLLKPGAFIDPNPTPNVNSEPKFTTEPQVPTAAALGAAPPSHPPPADGPVMERPDWLPAGWTLVERVRSSGASAGTRDKYYLDPVTNRQFRSKKDVLFYLENGIPKSKKNKANSNADNSPQTNTPTPKRKKSDPKAKPNAMNFNYDNVPLKVKWVLEDVYEGTWRPLINSVDRVPESAKQEWAAAFTYLTLQNGGRPTPTF